METSKEVATGLKTVYQAPAREMAEKTLDA